MWRAPTRFSTTNWAGCRFPRRDSGQDHVVFNACLRRGIPVAVVLAGGYARYIEDTVEIHANTVVALSESLRDVAGLPGAVR